MPPSFRSENPAERGDGSPLLPASGPGREEKRRSGTGQKKESEKLRFGKFRGGAFTGKPEPLSLCQAAFFDAHGEKIRKNPLSKPKILVKVHNQTFTK